MNLKWAWHSTLRNGEELFYIINDDIFGDWVATIIKDGEEKFRFNSIDFRVLSGRPLSHFSSMKEICAYIKIARDI